MILILYNILLAVVLVLATPWWLWGMATRQKYRDGLLSRLGRVPKLASDGRPLIWIHAVSVGEVLAVSRLVAELGAALPDHFIAISTTTRTGQALAQERFGAERVFYCPLDLPWAVRAFLNALKPSMLVLAETEFWPNLLWGCFRRGVPVAVVNARISDRSWPRYLRLRWFWKPFLSRLSVVLAQSETDGARLKAIGCSNVSIGGNLKFDVRAAGESAATQTLRVVSTGLRFVVAGSTLNGEEALLLRAWPALLVSDPNLALILAPRHPERFAAVASLLEASGPKWRRHSELRTNEQSALAPGEIVLLDSIGELASIYSLASVAFVGGSLVSAGGHNPLEPAQFGVPIVMGPHYANFRTIVEDLIAADAIRIATPADFARELANFLRNENYAQAIGARARQVFANQSGATRRSVDALIHILSPRGSISSEAGASAGSGEPRLLPMNDLSSKQTANEPNA